MLATLLAVMLTVDGGFAPVVLDVNHAALWENLPDGGVSDAPTLVRGGIWADDRTAELLGKGAARGTAERTVPPDASTETTTMVGVVMFAVGLVVGGVTVGVLALTMKK